MNAVDNGNQQGRLTLVCSKCTRERMWIAPDRHQADLRAQAEGWRESNGKTICPKCPGGGRA